MCCIEWFSFVMRIFYAFEVILLRFCTPNVEKLNLITEALLSVFQKAVSHEQ